MVGVIPCANIGSNSFPVHNGLFYLLVNLMKIDALTEKVSFCVRLETFDGQILDREFSSFQNGLFVCGQI